VAKKCRQNALKPDTPDCPARPAAGEDSEVETIVVMTRTLCFRSRPSPRLDARWCAENEFSRHLLKDGFNCRDLAHTGYKTRIHPW
jgi:hypothetical protein